MVNNRALSGGLGMGYFEVLDYPDAGSKPGACPDVPAPGCKKL